MKKTALFIAVLTIAAANGLWGQGGIYLGGKLGFTSPRLNLGNGEPDQDLTFLYGAQAGVKFFNLGVEVNYYRTAHNLDPEDLMNTGWAETRLDYHFLGLNGKLFFPLAVFHPYVTAGIGYYTADITAVDEDTSRGFNLGAGMEIHLGSTWAICGEGRYNHVNLVLDEVDTEVQDFTFTGSVHFYF